MADEEFIERIKVDSKVPMHITRSLLFTHGINKAIYNVLRAAGYGTIEEPPG